MSPQQPTPSIPEAPCTRTYFYVGGSYNRTTSGHHVHKEQMYVEHLLPVPGITKKHPLIFIHGNGQTGTNWLQTPDNRPGWASFFLSAGYELYIIDQTLRGRSPHHADEGRQIKYPVELIESRFTAPKAYNLYPQSQLHTQWPGTGRMGDPVFDGYYASVVPSLANQVHQQKTMQTAGAALLDKIGKPAILISHSQGSLSAWAIADARPALVKAHVSIEGTGPPFQNQVFDTKPARPWGMTDMPLTWFPPVTDPSTDIVRVTVQPPLPDQLPYFLQAEHPQPRKLSNLAAVRTLVVTGEASYHAVYDFGIVEFLKQAGVPAEHLDLGARGIHGNGHMIFMERNSDEIAAVVEEWIEEL